MKIFEKKLLKFLLELYDASLSCGMKITKKRLEEIEEIRITVYKPEKFRCYKSRGMCCYSLSSFHMKKCPGLNKCFVGSKLKKEKQAIKFE